MGLQDVIYWTKENYPLIVLFGIFLLFTPIHFWIVHSGHPSPHIIKTLAIKNITQLIAVVVIGGGLGYALAKGKSGA